jgi:DNA-binding MarR family transcriptional regulator
VGFGTRPANGGEAQMKKLDLLKIIQNNPGINVQDLTEASRIDANMVIKLLNDMEREEWITRHRFDRHTCQVITAKGLDKLQPKAPKPAPQPKQSKTVSRIESCKYSPNADILYKIIEALEIELKLNNIVV